MNDGDATPHSFPEVPPVTNWSWRKTIVIIALAYAAHLAMVFLLGTPKTVPPRAVTNVPVFHIAAADNALAQFTDPTLFALPHASDFPPGVWVQPPAVPAAVGGYDEPPAFLGLNPADLGSAFSAFMRTNRFAQTRTDLKPSPQLAAPAITIESALPQSSSWQLAGPLAERKLHRTITAPDIAWNDVLAPSRLQLLVDAGGHVLSAIVLETCGSDAADQTALNLARNLQFAPAPAAMFGQINFYWHTVPTAAP